ncbi:MULTISPECIES: hypothetical protein [Mycobacterium]|uniref:hypothetical protein n=1 Tax=Mycobacterium TaxID=1763 RepID=UPI00025D5376|nr:MULTISPECIES: hypothetical protein [Mycobacterium]AFJ35479.1 hypothetical protein W7S_12570 [Mycobacterium sp. MOTT36Y]ASX00654.1 hypothetical protein CKJ58_12580 [Mycobacterium intracellulare subsp. chimaera]ELR85169.1 hypothetical protein W7U_08070 [Mycobacterium sp. H4Y]PBA63425.1 hypothetical protein CKJ56_11565 [Mycobacterium intracellulare subsp. chimaera]
MSDNPYRKYSLLPYTRDKAIAMLRRCWQVGDTLAVAEWLGVEYIPPTPPEGMDLSDEWRYMVEDARKWLDDIYHRLYEPVHA